VAALVLMVSCGIVLGRAQSPGQPSGRRPTRMARLTYVVGQVQLDGRNGGNAQPAVLNVPVLEGSVLSTANDGQAEIEFEDGSVVRLTPNSALSVVNLSVDGKGNFQTRLSLLHGLAYLELRSSPRYQYSLDAQGDTIAPVENSTFRVDIDQPPAIIAVLDGKVHVAAVSGGSAADAAAGQTLRSDAAPGQPSMGNYLVKDAIDPDSWDQWNVDRDLVAANAASNQTVARNGFAGDQGYGWSDLDANGSWYEVPGQGEVWQPYVAADGGMDDFDPYGYGDWSWTQDYGYVWASGYAWGWTPYRCGNWGYWGGFGWGWSPGPSCGVYGFGGLGFRLNLHRIPRIYHGPRRPPAGLLPAHPLIPVHGGQAPASNAPHVSGVHTIAGTEVRPLPPLGGAHPQNSTFALGAALQRDFPIDRTTHQPIVGMVASHAMPVGAFTNGAQAAWRPAASPASGSGSGPGGGLRAQAPRPAYVPPSSPMQRAPGAPATGFRPQPSMPSRVEPVEPRYTPPSVPRYSPPPAVPRYSPPPEAPRYSAPPPPPPPAARPSPKR
jgi:FecR protein